MPQAAYVPSQRVVDLCQQMFSVALKSVLFINHTQLPRTALQVPPTVTFTKNIWCIFSSKDPSYVERPCQPVQMRKRNHLSQPGHKFTHGALAQKGTLPRLRQHCGRLPCRFRPVTIRSINQYTESLLKSFPTDRHISCKMWALFSRKASRSYFLKLMYATVTFCFLRSKA